MDNTIDVEVVPAEIVRCPRCGARNRLLKQQRQVGYRCGGCSAALKNPFAERSLIKGCFQKITRRVFSWENKYIGLIVIGILVVLAVGRNRDEQPSHGAILNPPEKIITVSGQPVPPLLETPAAPRSLENGTVLSELMEVGHGQFTVQNDTDRDAVVKLIDESAKRLVVAVYIRAYSSTTIDEMPEGSFGALCGQGVDWDDGANVFKRKKSFARFKPDFDFTLKLDQTEHQIIRTYKSITLELAPSVVGNITKSDISEKTFLQY